MSESNDAKGWDVISLTGSYGLGGRRELDTLGPPETDIGRSGTIIDLSGLTLMDSVVLSWIVRTRAQLESHGRQLRLAGAARQHLSVLTIGGLDEAFAIYPDVDSARSDRIFKKLR